MKSRILVAAVGIPALLYVVLAAPPWVMMAALCLLAGIGGMELQRCVGGVKRSELVSVSTVAAAVTVGWIYDRDHHLSVIIMLVVLLAFFSAIEKGGEVKFSQIMAGTGGSLFIGWSFASFLRLEASGIREEDYFPTVFAAWVITEKTLRKRNLRSTGRRFRRPGPCPCGPGPSLRSSWRRRRIISTEARTPRLSAD